MTARTICLTLRGGISVGPSESVQPAGCLLFDDDERHVDMNGMGANGWWRTGHGQDKDLDNRWLHSDMKDSAYFYVHPLFINLVNTGGLK